MEDKKAACCPVCETRLEAQPSLPTGDSTGVACIRCGTFVITGSAQAESLTRFKRNPRLRQILSHAIRRMQRVDRRPILDPGMLGRLDEAGRLPSPAGQAENLLLWLGDHVPAPGELVRVADSDVGGAIGSAGDQNFHWVVTYLLKGGLLEGSTNSAGALVTLSFRGWQIVEELRRGRSDTRQAFMAMPYGYADLDDVVESCFKPAVAKTGFLLERLDEDPKAGLIDDRLRVKIRTCRFLIADLTSGNQGAYWEAGFAEGLGKPVIYTCEKTVFEEKKTHFDTNHHLTLPWDKDALSDAGERLKATVRATLPNEAKLSDE